MQEILELATKLGRRMAADPRAQRMAAARTALDESLEDRQILHDYEEQQRKVGGLEAEGKPIEPEDKRRLAELHAKLAGSEVIKALLKAQADYVELMTAVSQRIEQETMGSTAAQDK